MDIDDTAECRGPPTASWDQPGLYRALGDAGNLTVVRQPAEPGLVVHGPDAPPAGPGNVTSLWLGSPGRSAHPGDLGVGVEVPRRGGTDPVLTASAPETVNRSRVRSQARILLEHVTPANGTDVDAVLDALVADRTDLGVFQPDEGGGRGDKWITIWRYRTPLEGPFRVENVTDDGWNRSRDPGLGWVTWTARNWTAEVSLPVREARLPGLGPDGRLRVDAADRAEAPAPGAGNATAAEEVLEDALLAAGLPEPAFRNLTYQGPACPVA